MLTGLPGCIKRYKYLKTKEMKTRLVMWGTNEKDEKVLIAIALRAEDNVVDIFTFPFESTSEEFYNLMLNEWRESHEVPLPEGHTHIERPLTASDSLLPDNLKVDRMDIIQRAQTEWHFVVLSNKLYQSFLSELHEIRDKIKNSDVYKNQLWEEMKEAWEKIQKNIFDKTLMREHGQQLREMTNDIFTALKNMRKDMDSEVDRVSREFADKFNTKLDEVEEKIKSGLGLQPLFNDLKRLQQEFKDAQLSRNDRSKIWKRIDVAFKAVKEKKFGEKSTRDTSALDRLSRRYEGLLSAIEKMEKSIKRDDKDKSFQDDRIANTEGQLEAQIRMAKLKMIDERINSKNEKLAEMEKTKQELEERINREKKFLEEQRKQQAMKEELKEAKEKVKEKIADNIHAQADALDADALGKAAEAIASEKERKARPKQKESILGAISSTLGESLEDVGDNIGAIATVVAGKIGDALRDIKEETEEKVREVKEEVNEKVNEFSHKMKEDSSKTAQDTSEQASDREDKDKSFFSDLSGKIEHAFKDIKENADELLHDAKEELDETIDKVKQSFKKDEKAADPVTGDPVAEKDKNFFADLSGKMEDGFKNIKENADQLLHDAKEELDETIDKVKQSFKKDDADAITNDPGAEKESNMFSDLANNLEETFKSMKEEAGEIFREVKEELRDTVDEVKEKMKKKDDDIAADENPDDKVS